MLLRRAVVILFLSTICALSVFICFTSTRRGSTENFGGFHVTPSFAKMEVATIKLLNDRGDVLELEVKVADEPDERMSGFQFVSKNIIERSLILFVFPEEIHTFFHMRNVETSLDIAFFRADGTVVDIMRMDPGENLYGPTESFKYALEAKAGFFEQKGIGRNSRLLVESLSVTAKE